MTIPQFRSTAAYTRRQRTAPMVDRATFVLFALGLRRFAVPVESVERVLRHDARGDGATIEYGGRHVPAVEIARALELADDGDADARAGASPRTRTLIFSVHGAWVAATVDAVFEVATIDAASVLPLPSSMADVWTDLPAASWPAAARGVLTRSEHAVVVLDMARVLRTLFEREQAARGGVATTPQ